MKQAVLFIDTASNEEVEVSLELDGGKETFKQKLDRKRAQVVLPMIDSLLKKYQLTPLDITEIRVNTGSGSFTGLRVGVSIANTISEYLQIPINDSQAGTIVEPHYS